MTPPPTRPTLFPYTTLFRSLLTLEVLHRLDGALGKDAVTADGGVDRKDFDGGHAIGLCARERIDGGGHAFQPARGQREERSEEHTSELQSLTNLVCRLLLEK